MNLEQTPPKGFKLWMMTIRAYAFPASIIPVIYGSLLAVILNRGIKFDFLIFFLTLIGSMCVHVGANIVNDIFDYKKGIDKENKELGIPHGGSMVLSMGLVSIEKMKIISIVSFVISLIIGIILWLMTGIWVLYLMIFGLFASIFYTATPLQLKYKALGDIMVFLAFGTGMTFGAYYVQTKEFSWLPIVLSIPLGFLIDAILHSNNMRDVKFDNSFGIKTIPILVGEKLSKYFYYFLIIGAYLSIVIFVILGLLPWPALLNFITLPTAIKLIKMAKNIPANGIERFEYGTKYNLLTAQFNMQFGLTLASGLLVAYLFFL
ncbi:MAG: prenyltransferase [Ignavibacteria bacterium]|nr:prenyltransferase [Ignavibacteria bacterium]